MSGPRTIGVTGASGFIGRHLLAHFAARGWSVRAFQRSAAGPAIPGVTRHEFRMPDRIREEDFQGLEWLVHAALAEYGPRSRDADRVNLEAARRLIAIARAHGTRIVFLSTLSAHPAAESHYGRSKLELEALFDPARDAVLRLGLVLGREGGLFGSMVETLRGARVVPLVDGGRQPIQVLAMDDLLAVIERVVERGIAGRFEVASPEVRRMGDLYAAVMARTGAKPLLVPVPLGLVAFGVATLERLGLPAPVTSENVIGLKNLRAFDTAPSLARLGVEVSGLEATIARLLPARTSSDAPTDPVEAGDRPALAAALRLHACIANRHLHEGRLAGADQGVRWNIRVWRFVRSYLPALRHRERYFFVQGQAYWACASWTLGELTGAPVHLEAARAATRAILESQRPDGAWDYPLPERRHLRATVEGDFGAVALLEGFRHDRNPAWLEGAVRWHDYVEREIGYQSHRGGLCVNYFQKPRGMVPNNTCEWIWVLGRLSSATGDPRYLARIPALLTFLEAVQLPTGELPYELRSEHAPRTRLHYLCYQYNAFQCMKLAWYAAEHGDPRARALAERLSDFLVAGVLPSGAVRASCGSRLPEVVYYADAVGMALRAVSALGSRDHTALADRTFRWVIAQQRADGGFGRFSRGDYYVLSDRNDYPRFLAMTLFHLAERGRDPGPAA